MSTTSSTAGGSRTSRSGASCATPSSTGIRGSMLLVGDASEDAQGRLGTSDVDYVPTPVIQRPGRHLRRLLDRVRGGADRQLVRARPRRLERSMGPGPAFADMIIGQLDRRRSRDRSGSRRQIDRLRDHPPGRDVAQPRGAARGRRVLGTNHLRRRRRRVLSVLLQPRVQGHQPAISKRIITQEAGLAAADPAPVPHGSPGPAAAMLGAAVHTTRDLFQTRHARAPRSRRRSSTCSARAPRSVNVRHTAAHYVLTHENLYISPGSDPGPRPDPQRRQAVGRDQFLRPLQQFRP